MKISVIIPVHNGLNFLGFALDSLLQQTYEDFEIMIIDDASSEDILGFLKASYLEFIPERIQYIRNDIHRERCYSRNLGIERSTGEIITFLDHDDRFKKCHLSAIAEVFKDCSVKVAYSVPEELIDFENNVIGRYHSKIDEQDLIKSALYASFSMIGLSFRKETLCEIGKLNLETVQREDYELACRTIVKYKLNLKVFHSNSIQIRRVKSKNFPASKPRKDEPYIQYSKKVQQIIEGYVDDGIMQKQYLVFCYDEITNTAITFGDLNYALKTLFKSVVIYPFMLSYIRLTARLIRAYSMVFI